MKGLQLIGLRFGRLSVKKRLENNKHNQSMWWCKCDCGKELKVRGSNLTSGTSNSCGCYQKDKVKEVKYKHGKSDSRLFRIWAQMKDRCSNSNGKQFKDYGGRGISVCDEWLNNFSAFQKWAEDNGYNDDLTIDRIDNDGIYEPGNCRWCTRKEQSNNTRRNRKITYNGISYNISQIVEITGIHRSTINGRIRLKWREESITKRVDQ